MQWVTGALSLRIKQPGHEADHSAASSVEVKECVELYIHSPNTSSWSSAQFKKRAGTNLPYIIYIYIYIICHKLISRTTRYVKLIVKQFGKYTYGF
jgi:hypothetical protein